MTALAAFALLLQVLIPQGFMIGGTARAPALVVCTGHGALAIPDPAHPAKPIKRTSDAPCVFAGHGLGAPGPELAVFARSRVPAAEPAARVPDLAPGRGLAAPPPPAQAPPTFRI